MRNKRHIFYNINYIKNAVVLLTIAFVTVLTISSFAIAISSENQSNINFLPKQITTIQNIINKVDDTNIISNDEPFDPFAITWSVTLNFNEPGGAYTNIVFGEGPDASDGQDSYDTPMPPAPPAPYIRSWFKTNLTPPYNTLLKDYRHYPDTYKLWNFSVRWESEDGETPTTITISWSNVSVNASEYDFVVLYNNTNVANMLVDNSYTFDIGSGITYGNFKIICNRDLNPPEIINNSPGTGETGDSYTFNATVTDNLANASSLLVKVDWSHGSLSGNDTMTNVPGTNYFTKTITLDESTSDLTYHFYAIDNAKVPNTNYTAALSATISDDENPVITGDSGIVNVGTGNIVTLWVTATDNIGVTSAKVSIDGGAAQSMSWNASRWEYNYTAPYNSAADHNYTVTVYDAESLSDLSGPYDIIVTDDDPPVITGDSGNVNVGTGDPVTLWVTATDNIAVTSANVTIDDSYTYVMVYDSGESRWEYVYNAPSNNDSDHTYFVTVYDAMFLSDSSPNSSYNIVVTDNDPPVITGSSGNVNVGTGDSVTLWVTATDNIGVTSAKVSIDGGVALSMSWNGGSSRWEYVYNAPSNNDSDHTYVVTVYDAMSLNVSSGPYNIVVTDNDPPLLSDIAATPNTQITDGYVNITANATDNININTIKVYITGPTGFTPINASMTHNGGNVYYYNNNYSKVGTYNYSIWARDDAGNGVTSAVYQFIIIAEIKVSDLIYKWNFISLPINQSVNKNDLFVILQNGSRYNWSQAVSNGYVLSFIYGWNRTSQSYEPSGINVLIPGEGYWIYAYNYTDMELWVTGIGPITPDNYITPLKTQWNIVGVPANQTVNKTDLIINYGGVDYNWSQAVSNGYVLQFVFEWNRSVQNYAETDLLKPGECYWLYAYYNCTLKWG